MDGYIETLRSGIADGNVARHPPGARGAAQAKQAGRRQRLLLRVHRRREGRPTANCPRRSPPTSPTGRAESADGLRASSPTSSQNELAPHAPEKDAVGRELYALASRDFLGATVDLDETYEWGIEELARMVAEQESIAREIKPGASVREAIAFLDRRRQPQAARHRRAAALDAGDQRPRDRRARQVALRHPRPRSAASSA